MKHLLIALICAISASAFAKNIKLIDIKSEIDSDITQIGISTANGKSISHVYFQDPTKPILLFTMDELASDKRTIVKKSIVPIIQLSAESITPTRFILNVHYMHHYKLVGSVKKVKPFKVSYIGPADNFEIVDTETKKAVKNAFARVNTVNGKEVGISTIETW